MIFDSNIRFNNGKLVKEVINCTNFITRTFVFDDVSKL